MKRKEMFIKEQEKLISKISLKNRFIVENIKLVTGVDIAYWTINEVDYGICCIVIVDYKTKRVIEKVDYMSKIEVPYIPGYLAFRELPLVQEAAKKLSNQSDIYMFDGNGYLHHRHMGMHVVIGSI